jgi:hypothetical protein
LKTEDRSHFRRREAEGKTTLGLELKAVAMRFTNPYFRKGANDNGKRKQRLEETGTACPGAEQARRDRNGNV